MIKIGHAGSDERGKYSGGVAGDQTGREVCIREWYNRPWNVVVRPKRPAVAQGIVKACKAACANDKIGYDQYQRTTLYTQAVAVNWDLSKITTPCETDCSALVAVCVNAAGVKVSKDIYTGNMVAALKSTGEFEILTASKYLTSDRYLCAGDILVYEGHHTAMALESGEAETTPVVPGWVHDDHGWWYRDPDGGYPQMCWRLINHHWYCFGASGYMLTGWIQWDSNTQRTGSGDWYYLEESGEYAGACWHEKPGDNGAMERWYIA